eukprot:768342-Hanusia_phi.AAC.4
MLPAACWLVQAHLIASSGQASTGGEGQRGNEGVRGVCEACARRVRGVCEACARHARYMLATRTTERIEATWGGVGGAILVCRACLFETC